MGQRTSEDPDDLARMRGRPVLHRDDHYPERAFATLHAMQERHFWFRGRHRFLLAAVDHVQKKAEQPWDAVDLGGGTGGWLRYLLDRRAGRFGTCALAESSQTALRMAEDVLPARVERHHVDILRHGWTDRWDCAFLLDVIEHLPEDAAALRAAAASLRRGGHLFVTAPALQRFWSYNDDLVHHRRRYDRQDLAALGPAAGLTLCDARYFMFLLSPLYWLARRGRDIGALTAEERIALLERTHRVPPGPVNAVLAAIFALETPIGHRLPFPWGTSILGVFRKP